MAGHRKHGRGGGRVGYRGQGRRGAPVGARGQPREEAEPAPAEEAAIVEAAIGVEAVVAEPDIGEAVEEEQILSGKEYAEQEKKKADEDRAEQLKNEAEAVERYKDYIKSGVKRIRDDTCWAVSMTEVVEGHYNRTHGGTGFLTLSPWYLITALDMHRSVRNFRGVANLLRQNGLPKESACSYGGASSSSSVQNVKGKRVFVEEDAEVDADKEKITNERVKKLLDTNKGPLLVSFITDRSLKDIRGEEIYVCQEGVPTAPHGMVVVGHGKSGNRQFWTVRNCYGPEWGKDGYGRICMTTEISKLWYPVKLRS